MVKEIKHGFEHYSELVERLKQEGKPIPHKLKIEYEWKDARGNLLRVVSGIGLRKYKWMPKDKVDRVYAITINGSEPFFPTHEQQIFLMSKILGNDILPHIRERNQEKFIKAVLELRHEKD